VAHSCSLTKLAFPPPACTATLTLACTNASICTVACSIAVAYLVCCSCALALAALALSRRSQGDTSATRRRSKSSSAEIQSALRVTCCHNSMAASLNKLAKASYAPWKERQSDFKIWSAFSKTGMCFSTTTASSPSAAVCGFWTVTARSFSRTTMKAF